MSSAGYSGTPLARKLGFKPGLAVAYVNAPEGFGELLGELPDRVAVRRRPAGSLDLVVDDTWSGLKLVVRRELR